MNHLIELRNIQKAYQSDELKTLALSGINLTINSGEYVSISGPSGCGKSTLLSILGMLDTPTEGNYLLAGKDVSRLTRDERATARCENIGFVFQSFNLISDLTVEENVILPLTYQEGISTSQAKAKAKEVLGQVDMMHRINHFPSALSGGQQQRVAIARALVNDPKLILADEPTGNLDSKNAATVLELFDGLNKQGRTIVMVTHDPRTCERANRQIDIFDGQLVGDRSTESTVVLSA